MAKNRIFTVGFDLPGDEFEYVDFSSDTTLLDADIILFEPTLGRTSSIETYEGKRLLDDYSSFSVKKYLDHWRAEIIAAVQAGKLVIVYLARPAECFRYTGEKRHSGTGRSRVTTNIVTGVSSYEAIPNLNKVVAKSGTEIQIDKNAKFLIPYWAEFSEYSPYEVEIQGEFNNVLLRSRAGDRILGAAILSSSNGALLFLPPLRYDEDKFTKYDAKTKKNLWTKDALQFGKRLVSSIGAMAATFKQASQETPPPNWASNQKYRLDAESNLEQAITECVTQIASIQAQKSTLEKELIQAGSLRKLLYEQGKPLEAAILEALRLLGFDAQPYTDGKSEFDSVFISPEGRCLGEAEGKDSKAINIDKFSQLERNLQEDFSRDEVTEFAKGALFGNAFRLLPVEERGPFFTDKCISAAQRIKAALIRTPDLFEPAKYLKENPGDEDYAKSCREAIFKAEGEVVVFPELPSTKEELIEEDTSNEGNLPDVQS